MMSLRNTLQLLAMTCLLTGVCSSDSTAFAAPIIRDQNLNSAAASIEGLVEQLTSPALSWQSRSQAEEQLKTFDSQSVLLALMPHAIKDRSQVLPRSSESSAEGDKDDPIKWQIFYGVQRSWEYHERRLWNGDVEQLASLSQSLLAELSDNPASRNWVVIKIIYGPRALWTEKTEVAFSKMMRSPEISDDLRYYVTVGLLHRTRAKYYEEAKALIKAYPETSSDQLWLKAKALELLLWDVSLQKNEQTGQLEPDGELLAVAFEMLPKMEQIRKGGGYFLALHLGDYVGQKFQASQGDPKYKEGGNLSNDFLGDTTTNAINWWQRNRD